MAYFSKRHESYKMCELVPYKESLPQRLPARQEMHLSVIKHPSRCPKRLWTVSKLVALPTALNPMTANTEHNLTRTQSSAAFLDDFKSPWGRP